ncbi:hypothetical protein G3T14_10680 [Methylobacterium sp. BTF04]|uniref:hypothetical protein n=1 Tax=Methylobacterium sp. BTF04 TaxID=2708300 RepID=UPI0013D85937|nr:hypothetical protein [Methylobacterium sp. BTF04]NEU12602.1 hypothetical protein [Methylobacterium sp. BTF04]
MTTKTLNRSHIVRAAWSHARLIAETLGQPIRSFIGATMRTAWALAKGLMPAPIPEMVPTPCQQQQACAAPAKAVSPVVTAMAEVERLEAKCAKLRDEKRAAFALVSECRKERIAAVAGEIDACPGVCWTNEERAEAAADEATDALDRCLNDYWEACDYLRDEEREERRASLKARIAMGPAMVMQPVQQQQARDQRPPEPREIRVTALGHLGFPCDPEGFEASLWIVTDGRLSRDCASHREALDLAEDFRVWGYVVPAR